MCLLIFEPTVPTNSWKVLTTIWLAGEGTWSFLSPGRQYICVLVQRPPGDSHGPKQPWRTEV